MKNRLKKVQKRVKLAIWAKNCQNHEKSPKSDYPGGGMVKIVLNNHKNKFGTYYDGFMMFYNPANMGDTAKIKASPLMKKIRE